MSVEVGVGTLHFIWTCPSCSFTTLKSYKPEDGEKHKANGFEACGMPWSYVEIGSIQQGTSGFYYFRLTPKKKQKRHSA